MQLTVDLGQSGARYKIEEEIISLDIAKNSTESVIATLERIFTEIPNNIYEDVFLSLTGLFGEVDDPIPYGELCNRFFQSKNVCVMDDGIAAYYGALGNQNGVVLTIGGGVVAISANNGRFGHADGKGAIFGDLGGGFWVGQTAMRRVVATLDGRASEYELSAFLKDELEEFSRILDRTGSEATALCISTAKKVAEAAEAGVESAIEILQEGAAFLANTILAAWRKVGSDDDTIPVLSIRGGLSNSPIYLSAIKDKVASLLAYEYAEGKGDHLYGASLLAKAYPNGIDPLLKWWRDSN